MKSQAIFIQDLEIKRKEKIEKESNEENLLFLGFGKGLFGNFQRASVSWCFRYRKEETKLKNLDRLFMF